MLIWPFRIVDVNVVRDKKKSLKSTAEPRITISGSCSRTRGITASWTTAFDLFHTYRVIIVHSIPVASSVCRDLDSASGRLLEIERSDSSSGPQKPRRYVRKLAWHAILSAEIRRSFPFTSGGAAAHTPPIRTSHYLLGVTGSMQRYVYEEGLASKVDFRIRCPYQVQNVYGGHKLMCVS